MMALIDNITDNEVFLLRILNSLNEDSYFLYPFKETQIVFKKENGLFLGNLENYSRVKDLVSPDFLQKYFKLKI